MAVPIDKLKLDPHQSRTHNRRSIEEIKRSLEAHGQKKNIVVAKSGFVTKAGHGTIEAAKDLGWTHLAAVRSEDSEDQLRQFAIRDNRAHEFGEWDGKALEAELKELEAIGSAEDLGFSESEIAALIVEEPEPPDDFPEIDEDIDTEHECPKCGYKWSGGK